MSTDAVDRIIKEVKALTPDERRELIDRLACEEQNSQEHIVRRSGTLKGTVKYMAPDFDESALPNSNTWAEDATVDSATLREWLSEARNVRAELPPTSESENTP